VNGIPGRTVVALLGIVRQYLNVERNFSGYQVRAGCSCQILDD
jgi:hypothetical protein